MLAMLSVATPIPNGPPRTPEAHRRGVEQSFLTYPEWFLVHSPEEYAAFVRERAPSDFPYLRQIVQFWRGYWAVARATRARRDPPNNGYHVMIGVIGLSTTVEYGLKAIYERLVGRPAELLRGPTLTAEDRLAAQVAQEYVDFIRVRPWYEFDFWARVKRVWATGQTPSVSRVRTWERRFALTNEYLGKAAYGWLIGALTRAAYAAESTVTVAVLDHLPASAQAALPELKVLATHPDGTLLVSLPRYAAFGEHALALARAGVEFREVAGNSSVILVSARVARGGPPPPSGFDLLLREPMAIDAERERIVGSVPIARLAEVLRALGAPPSQLEHVYDY
jgi:hypothetical protein